MSSESDGRENIELEQPVTYKAPPTPVRNLSSSTLYHSFSMTSQDLDFSAPDEVPQMIRRSSNTSEGPPSAFTQKLNGESYAEREVSCQRPKGLKESKSIGSSISSLESSTNLSMTIPLKRSTSLGKRNDILIGIVVSRWDNIVGPQCSYLWTEEMTSLFYPGNLPKHLTRLIKYVTDHTVDHHEVDGNLVAPSTMKSGLCIVQDLDLVYMSLSIRVPSDSMTCEDERPGSTVPHSVAVLARLQYLQHFILMRPLISNWLIEFAPKIGVLIFKNKLHLSMINSWCAELCKTMAAIRTCWWQTTLTQKKMDETESTQFISVASNGSINKIASGTSGARTGYTNNWEYLPPATGKLSLENIITSHLCTSCSTLVVGPDAQAINQVIRFLMCFSKSEDGYCSRYVLPTLPDTFMKGLFVQGLNAGKIGEKSISTKQLNSNLYPFTHIDLSPKCASVRQMPVLTHQSQRETTLIQELTALWTSTPLTSPNSDLFSQSVNESGTFVSKFVRDLRLLQPEKRYARLLLFRRMLHSKALGLIAYLQSTQYKSHKEKALLVKHLRETLELDEAEFIIIQMTAEKIRPGVLNILRT